MVVAPTSELCDIYFRNPAGQAETVKNQSWTSDVKAISCVCVCACEHAVDELVPDACSACSP